jgi:hypothetical protein
MDQVAPIAIAGSNVIPVMVHSEEWLDREESDNDSPEDFVKTVPQLSNGEFILTLQLWESACNVERLTNLMVKITEPNPKGKASK